MDLTPHHAASIDNVISRYQPRDDVLAVILGGSIAHGLATPTSDIDISVVVAPEEYALRAAETRLAYVDLDLCTYDGGYVDAKCVDLDFLRSVAESGSEPARFAYQDAQILFSQLPELQGLLDAVARYPIEHQAERMEQFAYQLFAWRWYHQEAAAKDNRYLEMVALQKLVLFTCRLVLAANARLFPYHKWMLAMTEQAHDRPADLMFRVDELLATPSTQRSDALVRIVLAHFGFDHDALNRTWGAHFMRDTELAWTRGATGLDDC